MDKLTLNLNAKRVFSVGISQAINIKKLLDEYIDTLPEGSLICKLYVGFDNDYFETIGFDYKFTDFFEGQLNSPIDLNYKLTKELPESDLLIVLLDTYMDSSIMDDILHNVSYNTRIMYLYDNLLTDYSNGEIFKRFVRLDTNIQTYNRRTDVSPAISTLLNKLKKYSIKYLTDPEIQSPEYTITFEALKDEEFLDFDKVIMVNNYDVGEYNIRFRNLLGRGFLPEPRDKMINYTPIKIKIPNLGMDRYDDLYIPIYSDLTVVELIKEAESLSPPIYTMRYINPNGEEVLFDIPINVDFINTMNDEGLDMEDIPKSYSGFKLYYSYVVPLYAVNKRYDNPLFIVDDTILNKSVLYTAIRFAKTKFKLIYKTNIYLG